MLDLLMHSFSRQGYIYHKSLFGTGGRSQVFELMEASAVKPDAQSFSLVMNTWSSSGLVDEAKAILDRMRAAKVRPDVFVYTILAKGYVRAQRPAEAEALLERMISEGVDPNVYTYTTVISGWCNLAQMEDALRVYSHMESRGIEPNLNTFHTLMWGFGEARQPHKADELLDTIQKLGITPDRKCLDLVGEAWRAVGLPATLQLKEARQLHMLRKESGGAPDSTTFKLGNSLTNWSSAESNGGRSHDDSHTNVSVASDISSSHLLSQTSARAGPSTGNFYVSRSHSMCSQRAPSRALFAVSVVVDGRNHLSWLRNSVGWPDLRVASSQGHGCGRTGGVLRVVTVGQVDAPVLLLPSRLPFSALLTVGL